MKKLIDKHKSYIETIYRFTFYTMIALVSIERVLIMIGSLADGEYVDFVIQLVLFTMIVGLSSVVATAIIGTIALVVSFIPYLIIRGLRD